MIALPVIAFTVVAALRMRQPRGAAGASLRGQGMVAIALVIAIATALTFVTPVDAPAIWLFFGVSMLVAAVRGQGGCEVVALPNVLFGREDRVSCILYGPLDAVESRHRPRRAAGSVEGRE